MTYFDNAAETREVAHSPQAEVEAFLAAHDYRFDPLEQARAPQEAIAALVEQAEALKTKADRLHKTLARVVSQMQQTCQHIHLLRVPEVVLAPVRHYLDLFSTHATIAKEIRDGIRIAWVSTLYEVPFKDANASLKALLACLTALDKAHKARPI